MLFEGMMEVVQQLLVRRLLNVDDRSRQAFVDYWGLVEKVEVARNPVEGSGYSGDAHYVPGYHHNGIVLYHMDQ